MVKVVLIDSLTINVFTDEIVKSEKMKTLFLYKDSVFFQKIDNINEDALALYSDTIDLKLEDYNKDNYLDLWILFSPNTRLYDSDYLIFTFNPRTNKFSNKREYLLKNLTEKEFKEKYGPLEEDVD